MQYTVVLRQESDGGFVVTVPSLPGCVTQGDSRQDALKNIEEALEVYIEDVRDAGEPVPPDTCHELVEVQVSN
jgi:predicted RNase H-like HicB family nuclease